MLGWEYPPHNSGGLGVACRSLSEALINEGIDVTFVLPKKLPISEEQVKFVFAHDGPLAVKKVNSLLMPYLTPDGYRRLRAQSGGMYAGSIFEEVDRYAELVLDAVKDEQFDVIHAHEWLSLPAGAAIKELTGKPLVAHMHSNEYHRSGGGHGHPWVHALEAEGMGQADVVAAVSGHTRDTIVDHFGIPSEQIEVVHNGVDFESEQAGLSWGEIHKLKRSGKKIVLFLGRLTLHKGVDYFIKAARRVVDYRDDVVFVIVGKGELEHQLIEQVAALGLSHKVLFAGFLRGDERDLAYTMSDVFVMPSVTEPFGLVPLEAIAHGTPAIVSKQSGVGEVLSHALKVDFWDVDQMAQQILAVIDHRELGKELVKNGQKQTKEITWKKTAKKFADIYNRLVG